jgi:4-nitrophenyl phosphatase
MEKYMIKINNKIVKGTILDMDGVLWRGDELLCDLPALFQSFGDHQVKVTLATNNGLRTVDDYVKRFKGFGVSVEPSHIITSAIAIAALVKKDFPDGGPVHIMGERALFETMEQYGFYHSDTAPQAVVAGLTKSFTYNMIKDASLAIQKGLPFYFTNPDPTYPSPEGIIPGAGTVLAALETASGVKATLAGKPLPFSFEVAMAVLETQPDETLVIGDRLSTDIQGGQNAGCLTALVLTGISTIEDYNNWEPKPDLLLDTITDLFIE